MSAPSSRMKAHRRMKSTTEKWRSYISFAHVSVLWVNLESSYIFFLLHNSTTNSGLYHNLLLFKYTRQISLYVFNKLLTFLLHRPCILYMRMCVCDIHMYISYYSLFPFFFFFWLHFLCAELGYLFFWMMQWVNKIIGRKSFKVQGPWHYSLFRFD